MVRYAVIIIMCAICIAGCSKDEGAVEKEPAVASDAVDVALTINGEAITGEEVAQEVARLMQLRSRGIDPRNLESARRGMRKEAGDNLITRHLLEQEVLRRDLDISPETVEEKIVQIKEDFGSEEVFANRIARMGLTEDDFRKQIEVGLGIEQIVEEQTADITVPGPQELEAYYNEHLDWYTEKESVRASHILITVNPVDDEKVRSEKRARAEELLEQIRGGANFAQLAVQHSDCPSKSRGGDLNYFTRGQMVGEFETAAFALGVDEVSDIVETKFGYHIIKVTDRKDGRVIPFTETSATIKTHYENETKEKALQKFLDGLRGSATIVYNDSTLME